MSSVWVPILPSLKGFTQKIEGESRTASQRGGKVVSEEFGKAGEASGRSLADGLKRQQALVSSASKTLGDARTAEANAAGAVHQAELELQRLRDRGDASASKIAKAEEDVADKKRRAETASERLTRAEKEHATVRDGGEASSRKLISAEDRVVDARNKVEKAAGEVRTTELRVTEAREKSETRAAALQSAEDNLATVRAEFGEDSRQAATAERQVEAARKQNETAARGVIDTETALAKKKGELQTANEAVASSTLSHQAVQEDLAASERAAGEEAERAASDIRGLGDEMDGAEPSATGLAGGLGGLAKQAGLAAAAFVGVRGIGDTISAGFDKVTSIEDTTASLGILMGSADDAIDVMDELTESNMATPYSFDAWAEAGKNLIAFGMDAEDVTGTVMALGEAASASGKGEQALGSMADAFGKASASGRISMDLINSLSQGGVDSLTILGNHFGVATDEMQKMISDGSVPVEEAFEALTDGIMEGTDGIAGSTGSMSGVMEEMSQTTSGQLGLLKMSFVNLGGDIMEILMPAIKWLAEEGSNLLGWIRGLISDFQEGEGAMGAFRDVLETLAPILKPIGATIGAVAGALGLMRLGMMAHAAATTIATTATNLFRGALTALVRHPIVAAIAAVVGALTYFFTQTETGQRVWESLMDALSDAWSWLQDTLGPVFEWIGETAVTAWNGIKDGWDTLWSAMQTAWDSVIKPVFDGFVQAGKILFAVVGTAVLGPLLAAWNLLSWGIEAGWNNIIKPAWDLMSAGATWLWEAILQPVFGWIRAGWELLSSGIQWYYENVILVAWNALQTAAMWLWENVLSPVFGWIRAGWEAMSTGIQWVYDTIIKPTWDALGTALNWLNDTIIQPVLGWIMDRWDDMGTAIEWVYDNVVQPVFDAIGTGLDVVKGVFETAVDGIETVWDGLRAAAAKPVKFVIDKVWNDGILKAWNNIAGFVPGLDEVDRYEPDWLGDYAHGTSNIVPGERSVGRDNMDFVSTDGRYGISLAGQEGIAHQHVVDGIGRSNWDHLNQVGRTRGASAVREELGGFATGGTVPPINLGSYAQGGTLQMNPNVDVTTDIQRSMIAAVAQAFPNQIVTSATRYVDMGSGYDNHMAGRAVDFAPDQALASWIASTYPDSAELFWDPGPNLKNGAPTGAIGGHSDHVHWAMASMVDPYTGDVVSADGPGGAGGGGGNWLYNRAKDMWDSITGPITGLIDSAMSGFGDTKFAEVPGAVFDETSTKVFDWIMGLIPFASGPSDGVDISGITGPIVDQVEEVFARAGWTGQQWEDAKWIINKESSWDPMATNPSSGAFGLFQFNPMGGDTLGTYLPDRNPDPAVQAQAGVRYIGDRYGDPTSARRFWEANGWYDQGGYLEPGITRVHNETMEPEPVLTGQQWRDVKGNLDFALAVAPSAESWERIANEITAAFNGNTGMFAELGNLLGDDHAEQLVTDVAAIRGDIENELLDFVGLSGTWMTDPSLLDISWETPSTDDDDQGTNEDQALLDNPLDAVAPANDSLVGETPASTTSNAAASEVSTDSDRVTLDRDMVVNIVMENVQTTDPNEIARETAREARRALAALRF